MTLLSLVSALSCVVVPSEYSALVMGDRPLAYWRLNESHISGPVIDEVGLRAGVFVGAVSVPIVATAGCADGNTSAAFQAPSQVDIQPSLNLVNRPFTLEAWIRKSEQFGNATSVNVGPYRRIIDHTTAGLPNGYGIDIADNALRVLGSPGAIVPFNTVVGVDYHIVLTCDGAGSATFYVNGQVVGSASYGGAGSYAPAAFRLGRASNGAAQFLGTIDEVAIYGYALSPEQVLSHWEAVFPPANADLNGDGRVDGADLGTLLGSWGPSSGPADLNADCVVDGADLGTLLGQWGPVP